MATRGKHEQQPLPAIPPGTAEKTPAETREREYQRKRAEILQRFKAARKNLSQEITVGRENLREALATEKEKPDAEKIRDFLVKDWREDADSASGVFSFSFEKNPEIERWVGLKHVIPDKYKYVEVRAKDGQKLHGTRRENGSFYDENGNYIAVWNDDSFKASVEAPKQASAQPPPATAAAARETRETAQNLPETPIEKTWIIGDSLSVGYSSLLPRGHIPANEIKTAPKTNWLTRIGSAVGGSLTDPMLKRMRAAIGAKRASGVEKVVIFGGVNDVGSGRSAEQTIKNLAEMYKLAREAGIKVVACTIPSWDTTKYVEKEQPKFCAEHKLTSELLTQRTNAINNWIRQQAASGAIDGLVDLDSEMGRFDTAEKGLKRSDAIHFRDYRAMTRAVTRGANINIA